MDKPVAIDTDNMVSIRISRGYPGPDDVLQTLREFDDAACGLRDAECEAAAANDKRFAAEEKYLELLDKLRAFVKKPEPAYKYRIVGVHTAPVDDEGRVIYEPGSSNT
jgi:hypothetical protein